MVPECNYATILRIPLRRRYVREDKSSALSMFHAIKGCDAVSIFDGGRKKTALEVWKVFSELTTVLRALAASP